MLEPVAAPKVKKTRGRRPEHVANTLYVNAPDSDDVFAPVKKKTVKIKQAKDYASFVAEVGDDEIDPYAIPSYGSTRLTHGDEELVEELASQPDRAPRARRRNAQESASDESEEKTPRSAKKGAQKRPQEPQKSAKGAANQTAAKTRDAATPQTPASFDNIADMTRKTQAALDSINVKGGAKAGKKESSSIETLASAIKTLVGVNLNLLELLSGFMAEKSTDKKAPATPAASQSDPAKSKNDKAPEKNEPPESKRQPGPRRRRGEPKPDDAPEGATTKAPAAKEEPEKRDRRSDRAKTDRNKVESKSDGYDDPFAFWESIEDDETPIESAPAKWNGRSSRDKGDDAESDFDEDVEIGSKKKSGRSERRQTPSKGAELSAEEDAAATGKPNRRAAKRRSAEPEEDESSAEFDDKPETKTLRKFGSLKLKKETLKALQAMGYSEPTPIQTGTIPTIQRGVDVMGQARTGTGKTAAFMIPIVEGVAECEPVGAPLAVAVTPTRELAVQVCDETRKIAKYYDLSVAACYGGKPLASQVEALRKGVDILVGTPGRIIDLAKRGALSLGSARWVVLDEADRMLDIGFRPDVERILRQTPSSRQTLLFSATLPDPVVSLAKKYMKEPEQFDFSCNDVSADTIEQYYLTVDQDRKFDALTRLIEVQNPRQTIVFCRTKRHVDVVARRLAAKFPHVEAIHGDLPQTKRDRIMRDFRAEKTKTLVATDVVGRGIDVSSVSHIVNYDVPQYCDDYVHRVGRAGRMGRDGVAFTLVTADEGAELTRIEIRINRLLERYEIPNFEAFSRPSETAEQEQPVRKPVYGRSSRRVSRAL